MANKFKRDVIVQQSLTMLTATEVKMLANTAQINLAEDENILYKYREEFLHIQQVAERGLTNLDMLIENTEEFKIVAEAWGFTATVRDRYNNAIVYTKNLNATDFNTRISNINIDWSKPTPATVDVEYYRQSGNLVSLQDSTLFVPKITLIKQQLGIPTTANTATYSVSAKTVLAKETAIKAASTPVELPPVPVIPDELENFGWEGTYLKYSGPGTGAYFQIVASAANGKGLPYRFYLGNLRPQGNTALNSRGYSPGEKIVIGYSGFRGTGVANNATITVTEVNSVGAILTATVSGTTVDGFTAYGRYFVPGKSDPTDNGQAPVLYG
jgi:hypothetical protein